MKLIFDDDFDGPVWTGVREPGSARFGEAELGPLGLLGLVEGRVGLSAPAVSDGLRAASLVKPLRETEGFWSRSAEVDPFGVADSLLRLRDGLWMGGWLGEPAGPRLSALSLVAAGVPPGIPDRLADAAAALARRSTDIKEVIFLRPYDTLPLRWRRLFEALGASGTELTVRGASSDAAPTGAGDRARARSVAGDRARALTRPFKPAGDGSLVLLRPRGPLAAAEMAAAWLAEDRAAGDVVIGADPLLDAALARFGLPTTGGRRRDRDPLLDVLPLVIEMGRRPPDPRRVMELLSLPRSPVPCAVAGRLAVTLREWPAVGSDDWGRAMRDGIAAIEPEERRKTMERRLSALFAPVVDAGIPYPVAALEERVRLVEDWLQGSRTAAARGDGGGSDAAAGWDAAIAEAEAFRGLMTLSGMPSLSQPQLSRLLARVRVRNGAAGPAQAGLTGLDGPGALAGPARRVLWWNFTRGTVPPLRDLPLTQAELAALAAAGVEPPSAAAAASRRRRGWLRPFEHAGSTVVLVCPMTDEAGEEATPHPLWDEVTANAAGSDITTLEAADLDGATRLARAAIPAMPLPERRTVWKLPVGMTVERREKESPSGADSLVGCPFSWLLQYRARLKPGAFSQAPELDGRTLGSLAHELLEMTIEDGRFAGAAPGGAADIVRELFDREGPRLVAGLFVPGGEARRAGLRIVLAAAAETLHGIMARVGPGGTDIEDEASCPALGSTLAGRTDLVVGNPPRVIDLKYSGARYHREDLEAGAALQLAAYSKLRGRDGGYAPAAYFIVSLQRLLSLTPEAFGEEYAIRGPDLAAVWEALEAAYEARFGELAAGTVRSPAGLDDPRADKDSKKAKNKAARGIVDGRLVLPPSCGFCDYGRLCGLCLEEA